MDAFELQVSQKQDLTFNFSKVFLKKYGVDIDNLLKKPEFLQNGAFTNLSLLISDQCPYTIKCICFTSFSKGAIENKKIIAGSIFEQLNKALGFIRSNSIIVSLSGTSDEITDEDKPVFSLKPIMEGLVNAIMHRDYNLNSSIFINIFMDRLEIVSPGGMPKNITKEDIINGVCETRNSNLAQLFITIGLASGFGLGIPSMMNEYSIFTTRPSFNTTENGFKIVLPNVSAKIKAPSAMGDLPDEHINIVMDYLSKNPYVAKEEAAELFGTQPARAYVILEEMLKKGILKAAKKGKKKIYSKNI